MVVTIGVPVPATIHIAGRDSTELVTEHTPLERARSFSWVPGIGFAAVVTSLLPSSSSSLPMDLSRPESSESLISSTNSYGFEGCGSLDRGVELSIALPVDPLGVRANLALADEVAEPRCFFIGFFVG